MGKRPEHFSKNGIQMANRYTKSYSTSLIPGKYKSKPWWAIPARMAVIKKLTNAWEKRTPVHCWWECKLAQPLQKTVWRFLKKLKMGLPYGAGSPFLSIYSKEMKLLILSQRYICTPMFIAALFIIAKTWK